MRFLTALIIAALILGAVGWSQHALTNRVRFDVTREAHSHEKSTNDGEPRWSYRIELTTTFDAVDDPFALRSSDVAKSARLILRYSGSDLLRRESDLHRGDSILTEPIDLPGEEVELFVQATPSPQEALKACGLRVRLILEDGAVCHDQTVWTDGGGLSLAATINVSLKPVLAQLDRGLGDSSK